MARPRLPWSLLLLALGAACSDRITAPESAASEPSLDVVTTAFIPLDPITFCNATAITISASAPAPAAPFPSSVVASGIPAGRVKVTATLRGYSTSVPADHDFLLVGPTGHKVMLLSDAGGTADAISATLTFDDDAAAMVPQLLMPVLPSGTYKPTNYGSPDFIPSPGPAEPYAPTLADFATEDPNGTWRLYVWDDTFFVGGSISNGWCVTITPLNSAPVADAGGPYTANEGVEVTFDGTGSIDDDNDIQSYSWDFGDGGSGSGPTVAHTYANGGSYVATLVVTDEHGVTSEDAAEVTIADIAPTATFSAPTSVDEGQVAPLVFTSPSIPGVVYAFDCGTGFLTHHPDAIIECRPPDNGTVTVRGRVIDADNVDLFTEYSAEIEVANVAPLASFSHTGTVDEGFPVGMALLSPIDVPADIPGLMYAFDCGAGYGPPSTQNNASCPTIDDGPLPLRAKIIDKDGGEMEYTATASVDNRPPVITSLTLPSAQVAVGAPVLLTATFADAGTNDTHVGDFQPGDGGPAIQGTVTESNGSGTVSATVTFAQPGTYTIVARVIDDDGGSDTRSSASGTPAAVVVVAPPPPPPDPDPVLGSVAGTGLFNSPAGAIGASPGIAARAAFAVGAKHADGGGSVVGHLELIIKLASFHFASTNSESLVITGGVARYRGAGTVNGAGSYGFQVTAVDGGLTGTNWWERLTANDKLRVRIWNMATGAVVYDNQPGSPADSDAASTLVTGGLVIVTR